jgi:DNA-binding CsgD family transcriptional regulator
MTTVARPPAALEAPHHNNLTCVKQYGCRLPDCVERNRNYQRNLRRKRAEGTWQPLIDATPAREHLRALVDGGLPYRQIAQILGIDWGDLTQILYQHKKTSPRHRIRPALAKRILTIPLGTAGKPFLINSVGTQRRIQALAAMGWPQDHIGRRGGWDGRLAWVLTHDRVTSGTADKISAIYDRLRVLVPEDHGVTALSAQRAREAAARRGWVSPFGWDGNIDDPNAQPDTDDTAPAQIITPKRDKTRNDEIKHLAGFGISEAEIARRVGLTRQDVAERLKKWRKEDRGQQVTA